MVGRYERIKGDLQNQMGGTEGVVTAGMPKLEFGSSLMWPEVAHFLQNVDYGRNNIMMSGTYTVCFGLRRLGMEWFTSVERR